MLDATSLAVFCGALFVAAGTPGPSIAALVAQVLGRGVTGVLPFLAGLWLGEAVWLSLAVFGLAIIAQTFHLAFLAIKYLGVAYLVYLAWRMWHAPVGEGGAELPATARPLRLFFTGMAVCLGNPKVMVFYLALLPTILDLGAVSLVGWAELVGAMLVVLAAIDLAWALAASQARRLLRSPRAARLANRIGATAMAGAATAIATR